MVLPTWTKPSHDGCSFPWGVRRCKPSFEMMDVMIMASFPVPQRGGSYQAFHQLGLCLWTFDFS